MIHRLAVLLVVLAMALGLLFLQNKVLVGEQELQAQLQAVDKPDAKKDDTDDKAADRTFKIVFVDLGDNAVWATDTERAEVLKRLDVAPPIKIVSLSPILPDHTLNLVVGSAVTEDSLKHCLQKNPYSRPNPPRGLFQLNPGIDISGGVEFICELRNEQGKTVPATDEVVRVLRTRLDTRGLTEPLVTKLSNGNVQVVIPGGSVADAARTRKVLEDTGRLEFREVLDEYHVTRLGDPGEKVVQVGNNAYAFAPGVYHNRADVVAPERVDPGFEPKQFYRLGPAELTGKDVADASSGLENGKLAVNIVFTTTGATRNESFTTRLFNTGRYGKKTGTGLLAILFDGVVQSAPEVKDPSSSQCQISGHFTQEEVNRLRTSLKAGSLAVKPQVLSERVVGSTLGEETVTRAMMAMGASFVLIMIFMAAYYRRLGLVANLCLIVTAVLIYATLAVFNATITLPGLAGLVLTIGMAVDTNILVFERIREELREEKGLNYAINHGYERAFWTIVDAHLTTFITALILYYIGSGPVKGFGLSLMIGIAINLFSGIYIGRLFTDWLCRGRQTLTMASWVPALRLPYVGWRHIGYAFSIITGILGAAWFAFGHLVLHDSFERNFDIDFTGGNMVQVIFKQPKTLEEVTADIDHARHDKGAEVALLNDLRKQPYVASISADATHSRQWVFRGRDVDGSKLEAKRDTLEEQRTALRQQADSLRSEGTQGKSDAIAIDKDIAQRTKELDGLQVAIQARTNTLKHQLSLAFPGQIANEGDEVTSAQWQDNQLTLHIATLEVPDSEQTERLAGVLAKRDSLAHVEVKPTLAPGPGLELMADFRQKPAAVPTIEVTDPVLLHLKDLFVKAGAALPVANAEAAAAFELYNATLAQAGKQRITVAKPFPATEHFSGQVAGAMKWLALIAILLSFLAILAYVAARFEFRFGIGAVVALVHDIILTVGLISILGIRIDLTVIAALLTIIGYSINGTIVTFDRIRENLRRLRLTLPEVIDLSIAQTMQRTVLTSATVIVTAAILLVFGGDALYAFTSTLLIGLILGTYSSVFVSAPLLMTFTRTGESLIEQTDPGQVTVGTVGTTGAASTSKVAPGSTTHIG